MAAHNVVCNPAEIAHIEKEIAGNPSIIGVGVLDQQTGQVRLVTYDETEAFSLANPQLQVMAGHESAAAMAGIPPGQARGFVLGKPGSVWHIINASHLNRVDGQGNTMQMDPKMFNEILIALRGAGVQNPIVQ